MKEPTISLFPQGNNEKLPTDAEKKLLEFGPIKTHHLEDGTIIQVLPTCAVPFDALLEKNWSENGRDGCNNIGTFRTVLSIHGGLIAKSPERYLAKFWDQIFGSGKLKQVSF